MCTAHQLAQPIAHCLSEHCECERQEQIGRESSQRQAACATHGGRPGRHTEAQAHVAVRTSNVYKALTPLHNTRAHTHTRPNTCAHPPPPISSTQRMRSILCTLCVLSIHVVASTPLYAVSPNSIVAHFFAAGGQFAPLPAETTPNEPPATRQELLAERLSCVRIPLQPTSIVLYDASGAPQFWVIGKPNRTPFRITPREMHNGHSPHVYFCCDLCDTPKVLGPSSEFRINPGTEDYRVQLINAVCLRSALGLNLECPCDSQQPPTCTTGYYAGACTPQSRKYECIACTNIDSSVAKFLSPGGAQSNSCKFECIAGKSTEKYPQQPHRTHADTAATRTSDHKPFTMYRLLLRPQPRRPHMRTVYTMPPRLPHGSAVQSGSGLHDVRVEGQQVPGVPRRHATQSHYPQPKERMRAMWLRLGELPRPSRVLQMRPHTIHTDGQV